MFLAFTASASLLATSAQAANAPTGNGVTLIHTIQTAGENPLEGTFAVEAIVTGIFPGLGGFFVEEEDADADNDPATSEGIFVESATLPQPGQKVRVEGLVANTYGLTRFTSAATVSVLADGALFPLPAAVTPELPVPAATEGTPYMERFEGMRVTFPQRLYVVDNYKLGQFGEISVSTERHLFTPTNSIDPNDADPAGTNSNGTSNVAAILAWSDRNARSQLIVDDGSSISPAATIPFLHPANVGGGSTLRLGDSVEGLSGILTFDHKGYRLETTGNVAFEPTNPRTASPVDVGGNLKVAGSNLLNYFVTFGGKEDRGADGPEELSRQRAKIVAGLRALNADIFALSEVQNNGTTDGSAIHDLLEGPEGLNTTNAESDDDRYAVVAPPTTPFGTDAIQVGLIYKPARIKPIGNSLTDLVGFSVHNRPPLAQLFEDKATGARFWVVANHFKSKGGKGATGADKDQGDGQGAFNHHRKAQAEALIAFVQHSLLPVSPDVLVMGDLNSYGEEDPIDLFRAAGFVDLLTALHPSEEPYSFLFDGVVGRLDQALATGSLAARLSGATEWHVNCDEPHIIDYNLDTDDHAKSPPKPDDRFVANCYRFSDHDPILLGFKFEPGKSAK